MPVKVYELAKELKLSNTETLGLLDKMGLKKLAPASDLDDDTARRVRDAIAGASASANGNGANGNGSTARTATPSAGNTAPAGEPIEIPVNVTVKELAERLGVSGAEVQKVLMGLGVLAGLNQRLAPDAVQRIAQKLKKTVRVGAAPTPTPPTAPAAPVATAPTAKAPQTPTPKAAGTPAAKPAPARSVAVKGPQNLVPRPPVVTIMGHVDHGKTTLLDTLRKASVAAGEAGGITQHIGAYQIETNGQRITFIDTPGHAAFSSMRQRGASVTDIIVIVVAADDSIMPQTTEAIKLAREAKVPIIVAINKIDLPDANPEQVMIDLASADVVPESFGGDVQTVNISAKKGEGIQDLLDTILLVSEAVVEPKADPKASVQGTIIEAKQEKGRGPVVTVLVQQGTLTVGDVVVAGPFFGRIRTMTDERNSKLSKAGPSTPVEIVGLNGVPDAGDRLSVAKDEKEARATAATFEERLRDARLNGNGKMTLQSLYMQLIKGAVKELNVVIKGDVQGSVQAVRDSLAELGNDEVRVRVLSAAVGPVSESDVLLAASDKEADEKNSLVVGFNVGLANGVERKAEQEHVRIQTFSIIYELIDAVKEGLIALLDPIYEEATLGRAEVRAKFKLPGRGDNIAGCYVLDGLMRRNAKARIFRGKDLLHTGDIDTLRRFKDDQREVQAGYECGLTVGGFNSFVEGDQIECFEMREVPREL